VPARFRPIFARLPPCAERFDFDADQLAKFLLERGDSSFGFDCDADGDFAAAVLSRFEDALEAGAIIGPPDTEVVMYAIGPDALVLAIRECELPEGLRWPLRQVATFGFDADEIACFGEDTYTECCSAMGELVKWPSLLLPGLRALTASRV
jgi:hypothetical protein